MPDKESGSDEVPGGRGVFGVMTDGGETGDIKSFLRAVSFNEVGGKKESFTKQRLARWLLCRDPRTP